MVLSSSVKNHFLTSHFPLAHLSAPRKNETPAKSCLCPRHISSPLSLKLTPAHLSSTPPPQTHILFSLISTSPNPKVYSQLFLCSAAQQHLTPSFTPSMKHTHRLPGQRPPRGPHSWLVPMASVVSQCPLACRLQPGSVF